VIFLTTHTALGGMALVRFLSGILEVIAAIIFLRLGKVEHALRINALLGLIGPLVFILVSTLGIVAIAIKLSPLKVILLTLGSVLVLVGTRV